MFVLFFVFISHFPTYFVTFSTKGIVRCEGRVLFFRAVCPHAYYVTPLEKKS
jgi:hypothetical protein